MQTAGDRAPAEEGEAARGGIMSRRAAVLGVGGMVALLALGAGARASYAQEGVIHPPGAQVNGLFHALCLRCGRCEQVCPTHVIGVAKVESGLMDVRTPKMEFRLGYCDGCDGAFQCIEVCPTGALAAFDPAVNKVGMAVVDEDSCQVFGLSATCGYTCMRACPADAIVKDEWGKISIDEEACWGCGACEYVCPTNAYRSYDGNPSRGINIEVWEGTA